MKTNYERAVLKLIIKNKYKHTHASNHKKSPKKLKFDFSTKFKYVLKWPKIFSAVKIGTITISSI
jgi:hypothetical protein